MNFSRGRGRREGVEISMIPLVDLFLSILVFFLVSTSFQKEGSFFVELPQARSNPGVSKDTRQIFITVGTKGRISINRREVARESLASELDKADVAQRREIPVVVRADRNVTHGEVVSILDIVREKGFEKVGMATQSKPGATP